MQATWIWIGISIYIAIALVTAFVSREGKSESMSDYFLGNRQMGGFVSAMSYSATTYSAFMLVGLAGLTYSGGVGALGFELIYLSGVTLVAIFGPRFWLVGQKYGYVTPSEMLGHRYESRTVGVITALTSCVFLIPYAAVQLAGVGYLVSGMSDGAVSFTAGTILATIMAIVFSLVAGLRSVAWTDSLQAIMMVISATLVVGFVVYRLGGAGEFFSSLSRDHSGSLSVPGNGFFSFSVFLGLTLPWIFFSISNPQVSQRLYTPRSMGDLRKMLLGFMVFGFIYTMVSVIWGFAALQRFPDLATGDLATPMLLASDLVPAFLGVVVMIGIIAAAVSTIDSIMLTLSSMVTRDVYRTIKDDSTEQQQLVVGKLILPVVAALAFGFAQLEINLIAVLSVSASAGLLVMVPPIIGAFFWKRGTAPGVLAATVVAGLLVLMLELTSTRLLGQGSGVWGLLVSIALFVGVSLATPAPEARAADFLGHVKEKLREHKAV
ncbi:sodium:solute symporter family protein [Janibacter sp. GS2]|uniref:sodium:solute symporter family protein n=1 Tax=Janibacter sp. GS2 TaxID=3442646 RepID=UPI003EBAB48C